MYDTRVDICSSCGEINKLKTETELVGNENKANSPVPCLSKMKNKTLPTCLQGNYGNS